MYSIVIIDNLAAYTRENEYETRADDQKYRAAM
jgi:hypothetical protein